MSTDSTVSLWIGNIQPSWTEEMLMGLLSPAAASPGDIVEIKLMRDRMTSLPSGYGFIECANKPAAEHLLGTMNGKPVGDTGHMFRLNWGSKGGGGGSVPAGVTEYSLFVGDLAFDVSEATLRETFAAHYRSVSSAKVMTDPDTGASKGYGFVRFTDQEECKRAIVEMNGQMCGTRMMRVSEATPRRNDMAKMSMGGGYGARGGGGGYGMMSPYGMMGAAPMGGMPAAAGGGLVPPPVGVNTTVFVGGVGEDITEDMLREVFSPVGPLWKINLLRDKTCAFVEYSYPEHTQEAIDTLNGLQLGSSRLRLAWGKSGNKGSRAMAASGSAAAAPPSMYAGYDPYAGAYGAYPPAAYYGGYAMPGAPMHGGVMPYAAVPMHTAPGMGVVPAAAAAAAGGAPAPAPVGSALSVDPSGGYAPPTSAPEASGYDVSLSNGGHMRASWPAQSADLPPSHPSMSLAPTEKTVLS